MSYRLSADVIGSEELKRAFAKAGTIARRELGNGLLKTGYFVEAKAKEHAPIEFGTLRGSINTRGPVQTISYVEVTVGTKVGYAPHQEYGTGIYGPSRQPIRPKRGKVLAFKSGGKWVFARSVKGVKGRFYFKQAREEGKPQLTENMRHAMARIVTALAA